MALPTFQPNIAPSPGSQHTPEVNLNETKFGDGYTLSSPNGLNHIREIVSLKWNGVDTDTMHQIIDFFKERGGHKLFYYTPFGYREEMKWTCKEWSTSAESPWSITAKLTQSFNLET